MQSVIQDRVRDCLNMPAHVWKAILQGLSQATPPTESGTIGRDAITGYLFAYWEAMNDVRYDHVARYEAGDVAVYEGFVVETNTGALHLPSGETLPATGKTLRVRSCDVTTVRDGEITSHHFYFDQLEFLAQLGLMPALSPR